MRRAGFTMIELIFVIVILGILAAVALPKFIGVSEQAHEGKLKAYVGSLNRTVAPAMWSKSLTDGHKGKINTTYTIADIKNQISPPEEVTDGNSTGAIACGDTNATMSNTTGTILHATVGDTNYNINCLDGSETVAPRFFLYRGTDKLVGDN